MSIKKELREKGINTTPGGPGDPRCWSNEKRREFGVDEDKNELSTKDVTALSEREAAAQNKLYQDAMPSVRGDAINVLNTGEDGRPAHPWIQLAVSEGMPLRSGQSGTTERFLNGNKLLGDPANTLDVRLAMFGFFIRVAKGHSYHEIMSAANGHGDCTYKPGYYSPLPPVDKSLLDQWAKAVGAKAGVAELNDDFEVAPEAVTGNPSGS